MGWKGSRNCYLAPETPAQGLRRHRERKTPRGPREVDEKTEPGSNTMIAQRLPIPEFSIREMELDDLAQVYHLGERLFTKDRYPFLYSTWDKREVLGHFNMEPELSLVADADGALAGFIIGTLIAKASWTYGYIVWGGGGQGVSVLGRGPRALRPAGGAHGLGRSAPTRRRYRRQQRPGPQVFRQKGIRGRARARSPDPGPDLHTRTPATTEAYVEGRKDYAPSPRPPGRPGRNFRRNCGRGIGSLY
jgi:hypothetical protein